MIGVSHMVPDTAGRATDWRDAAACRTEDPELFFPKGYDGSINLAQVEQAKAVCQRCPSRPACLAFALASNITDGIFGGYTHDERRKGKHIHPDIPEEDPAPATPQEAFMRRSDAVRGGHRSWRGAPKLKWKGTTYNPLHIAFLMAHGRSPVGLIRRSCAFYGCHAGEHLTDGPLRDVGAMCGTRSGYNRHKKRGEKACQPCRAANTQADKRWRATGTTRAAV